MARLYTFGCSFTQYWRWPTWADAMGREREWFENWGLCGAGNGYIFNSIVECNQRNKFGPDDEIVVMWTNTSREDRYVKNRWLAMGNVYWTAGNQLPIEYVKQFACERGYLIRDLAFITAARYLLESTRCRWKFLSMVPLRKSNAASGLGENPYRESNNDNIDVKDMYHTALEVIEPSIYEVVFNRDWSSRPGIADQNTPTMRDFHPTPMEHLEYIDQVFPGAVSQESTREWIAQCDEQARCGSLRWSSHNNEPEIRL